MEDIILIIFVCIVFAIPIIFIYKDMTDLHEMILKLMETNIIAFEDFDERLKKLENKKGKSSDGKRK